jgi:hypothetical protein
MKRLLFFLIPALLLLGAREANANMYEPMRESVSWDNGYYSKPSVSSFSAVLWSGGTGTAANPFLISNPNDLVLLAWAVKGGVSESSAGKYFLLTTDLDLNGLMWGRIGHGANQFRGVFDGGGHTIRNMKMTINDTNRGLFGWATGATIKNVKIVASDINCIKGSYVGVLVGTAENVTIENCHVEGYAAAAYDLGGFIGTLASGNTSSSISRSSSGVGLNINPKGHRLGGFVGTIEAGSLTISDCIYNGSIRVDDESDAAFGFMVGQLAEGTTLSVNRCVGNGRYTPFSNWWKDISFLVGLNSGTVNVAGYYYTQDGSANNDSRISVIGEGTAAKGATTKCSSAEVHSQEMVNSLNSERTNNARVWELSRVWEELSNYTVLVTPQANVTLIGGATPNAASYTLTNFPVRITQNGNVRTYPKTNGTLQEDRWWNSKLWGYMDSYDGGWVWNFSANAEFITIGTGTEAYPSAALSVVYDSWGKKITVSGSRASGAEIPGKWQLFRRTKNGNTWPAWKQGDFVADLNSDASLSGAPFSWEQKDVAYDQTMQFGVRFNIGGKDEVPPTPETCGGVIREVSTAPSISVNNLKATNGTNSVTVSFTADYRLNNTNTSHTYSIWRKKNDSEYVKVDGDKTFGAASSGSGERTYTYTDNTDLGTICDVLTYKVTITALENHEFTSGEVSGHVTGASTLGEMAATKGEYSGSVRVSWTTNKVDKSASERYKVWRRVTGKAASAWSELATINTTDASYIYTDDRALPGVYYDYRVELYQECNSAYQVADEAASIGFAQSLGTASGRITYGTGTAVSNVSVLVKRSEVDDGSAAQYASLRSDGGGQTAYWEPDSAYFNDIVAGDFTLQLYLYPDADTTTGDFWFASVGNGTNDNDGHVNTIWLALRSEGSSSGGRYKLLLSSGDGASKDFETPFTIPANKFTHLSLVRQGGQLTLYAVNDENRDSVFLQDTSRVDAYTQTNFSNPSIRLGYELKGNLDEVRFWGRALGETEILRDYNRLLTGGEADLKAYWTFDEPVDGYIFDASRSGMVFNNNHGRRTLASDTERIPNENQLALKGITDADGNYQIRGIPFSGEGTSYDLVPTLGVHQFQPSKHLRYVSNASLVHNGTDFTDISSFKVSGRVLFEGSDYPVEGVQLSVDGSPASRDNEIITTDGSGEFEIDVPIGEHFVTVSKTGHTFVNNGRYPAQLRRDFQNNITGLAFTDNTLVRIVGRVAGGNVETNKQLGFGLSKANIGKATVTIETRNDSYQLNLTGANVTKTYSLPAPYRQGGEKENSVVFKTTARGSIIEVSTNPETGEFAVELPPVPYNITGVTTKNLNSALETFRFDKQTIDVQPNRVDSLTYTDTAGNVYNVHAHDTLRIAYYSEPEFAIRDLGNPYGAFGDSIFVYNSVVDRSNPISDTIRLYSVGSGGAVTYTAGRPVFSQATLRYTWEISAFEEYENTDNGAPAIIDRVPLQGQAIDIDNALASHTVEVDTIRDTSMLTSSQNTVTLNADGRYKYVFQTGFPNLWGSNLLAVKVSFNHNDRVVTWNGDAGYGEDFTGYLLGQVPSGGSNFTTAGPDHVDIILHDPPGSGSYAYIEKGSTFTTEVSTSTTKSRSWTHTTTAHVLPKISTIIGFICAKKVEVKPILDFTGAAEIVATHTTGTTTTTTTTFTESVSTSSDPAHVGSSADVYIGKSINRLFGKVRDLSFYPEAETPEGVTPSIDAEVTGGKHYKLFPKEVLAEGIEFKTAFTYTQEHILTNLIPNTRALRNQLIAVVSAIPAKENVNWDADKKPMYYSTIPAGDPRFGEEGTYTCFINEAAEDRYRMNEVLDYNRWIKNWENAIKNNEEYRVTLFDKRTDAESSGMLQNRSFDAGVSLSASATVGVENISFSQDVDEYNETSDETFGLTINEAGVEYNIVYTNDKSNETNSSTGKSNECTFGYELAEEGRDALSVDVYLPITEEMRTSLALDSLATLHSYTFQTRAGQTSCPYEGEEITLFYTENNEHKVLNEGTFQIEKPELYIDNTKTATAENIPSGREASFTLQLQNLSDANLPVTYQLSVVDNSNPDGLILSIDGTPLTSPREYAVEYGEELTKTLKVRQSSVDILEYSNIRLALSSTCDENISSQAAIGVRYIPSSTDLKLVAINTLANLSKGAEASFRISEYDRKFRNFASIRLQYKNVNDHTWVTLREFINDTLLLRVTGSEQELITSGAITYTANLQPLVDGEYDFRAISVAFLGSDEVTMSSEEIRIVKDMKAPQLLGNPSPANGILTPEGEISALFNENIRSAYVKDGNISVKATLNGHKVAHATALKLGDGKPAETEAGIALAGRSFSVEAWVTRTPGQEGTLIAHGETFALGFNADNKVVVTFGTETFTSVDALPSAGWQYICFAYSSEAQAFNVYALAGNETKTLFAAKPVAAPYSGTGRLYVGAKANGAEPFTGAVHDLSLWSRNRLLADLSDKDQAKTGREQSLIGYWPLTEGHGTAGVDKARSRHLTLPGANSWYLNNVNKAVSFDGSSSYLVLNTANIPVATDESFLVEFWFRGGEQTGAATMFSCGDGVVEEDPSQSLSVGFDANGNLTLKANGEEHILSSATYTDNAWRHFALNVLRNGSVIAYVDGVAVKQLPGAAVAQMARAGIVLGARRYTNATYTDLDDLYTIDSYFRGELDEVRIWKAARTAEIIRQDIHSRLNGNENGLVAYYPFEATSTDDYDQPVPAGTLEDRLSQPAATGLTAAGAATGSAAFTDEAPALQEARALENVSHAWTVSSNKIVISITEPEYRVEGVTLELSVSNILDLNDNPLAQPISWTAYVNMNRLKWSDDELTISKEYLDEAAREVTISNESGREETWSLGSLPSWLAVSKSQGSIKPLSSEKLVFTVNPSTPVGSYEDIIYLTGSNQIDVPLLLSLKVTTQTPDWSVNPADFEHSMSLIGQLRFEGVTSEDTEDIVAAFVDGVCVGQASPIYYSRYDATFVTLDIYGTAEQAGRLVTFKAWDASAGRLYPVVATGATTVTFGNNKLVGSVSVPLTLDGENKVEQQIALAKGWSWISLNTQPAGLSVAGVFTSVQSSVALLKSKTAFSVPNGSAWSGDLQAVEIGKMYKISMSAPRTFTLAGNPADPQALPITLKQDWNWIGYTAQASLPLEDALADLDASEGDLIKGQSRFAIYTRGAWVGSLVTLAPGSGYLYRSAAAADKQFRFPSMSVAAAQTFAAANSLLKSRTVSPAASTQWKPVSETQYSGNMTIVAVVKDGNRTLTRCEVGVFAGRECRGAQTSTDGLLFITVAGDDNPTQLTFKVYDLSTRSTTDVSQTLAYSDDAALGTVSDPYVIELSSGATTGVERLAAADICAYPTVVSGNFYVKSGSVALSLISVYSVSGSLVRQLTCADSRTATLDLSTLTQGTYFVTIKTEDGEVYTVKILVET